MRYKRLYSVVDYNYAASDDRVNIILQHSKLKDFGLFSNLLLLMSEKSALSLQNLSLKSIQTLSVTPPP